MINKCLPKKIKSDIFRIFAIIIRVVSFELLLCQLSGLSTQSFEIFTLMFKKIQSTRTSVVHNV